MTQYTFLTSEEFNLIANQFDIGSVQSSEILVGGSENTNYLISTDRAKYVLTICEQKTLAEAINLSVLLEHLAAHHIVTSKVIRSLHNELVITWKSKPVILKNYIEGHTLKDLPAHLISCAGEELGKLHKVPAPNFLPKDLNYGISHFHEVELYAPESTFYSWLKDIEEKVLKYINSDLPICLIHSDVFYSNIIVSTDNSSAFIMDYEEACHYFRIFDLGMMIIGTCGKDDQVDLEKVSSLIKGYQYQIRLTDNEKKALQPFTVYAAAAMSFWRHKNFNYTKPTPGMENHFIALKVLADFVDSIPEDEFYLKVFN